MRGRNNKPLSSMTRLEAERESKFRAQEEIEKLEAMGQTSDLKARTWVQKAFQEQEEIDRRQWEIDLGMLTKLKSGKRKYYFRYLAEILMRFAAQEAIPRKYGIEVDLTDQGIVLKIHGTKYQGAFRPSGLISYDRHACKILAVKLGNTIAKLEGYAPTTETGVVLPDEEQLKIYG